MAILREQAEAAVDGVEAALREAGAEEPYALAGRVLKWASENKEMLVATCSRQSLVEFVQRFPE